MLDLNAWIDFDKIKTVGVGVDEKLDCASIFVPSCAANSDCRIADRLTHGWGEIRRWGNLYHLLVAALNGAVAFKQVHEIAVHITE